jgi:hypothetical protein
VQLYTGLRTRNVRKLRNPDPICTRSEHCEIRKDGVTLGKNPIIDLDEFARRDGFENFDAMREWFKDVHGLPFIGNLIMWDTIEDSGKCLTR